MEKNLWGDLSDLETTRTPTSILEEQAKILATSTYKKLRGEVEKETEYDRGFEDYIVTATFNIVVTKLNNYE